MTQQHIYHLNPQGRPEPMQEKPFDAEADLQKLVAEYPYLLGEQINPDKPRRFILIRQEQGIADTVGGGHRWYVDHLLIDQEGIPTLVEVKRRDNSEIRRSIVGQMLDYAAHAKLTLSVGDIRQAFEERVSTAGQAPDEVLAELLQEEPDADTFWQQVDANLRAGRMCLLFVADGIPDELTQVVEFLNEQMPNIDVLAVEIKQFLGETGSTLLVPRVVGRTSESVAAPMRRPPSQPVHTEATLIDSFAAPLVQDAVRRLFKVAQEHGANCRGRVSSVTIRQNCPAWNRPIAVAWLYEPDAVGWEGQKGFFFGAGNNTAGFFESLPQNLRDLLETWVNEFAHDEFATRANATGIHSYAISHADAADACNIDTLAERLDKVLRELRNLPPNG